MEMVPSAYYENLKRHWRRRKYQKLNGETNNKRKIKVIKLGGIRNTSTSRLGNIKVVKKLCLAKIWSPLRVLVKFHDAYMNMMIRLETGDVEKSKIAKGRQVTMTSTHEEIDTRLVLEIYNRMLSTRQLLLTAD